MSLTRPPLAPPSVQSMQVAARNLSNGVVMNQFTLTPGVVSTLPINGYYGDVRLEIALRYTSGLLGRNLLAVPGHEPTSVTATSVSKAAACVVGARPLRRLGGHRAPSSPPWVAWPTLGGVLLATPSRHSPTILAASTTPGRRGVAGFGAVRLARWVVARVARMRIIVLIENSG